MALTSFYEFHRRHRVEVALIIRDASCTVASTAKSFRPFLAHAKQSRLAGVNRSWLYTQPEIDATLEQLRDDNGRSAAVSVPTRQRASAASLVRRLEAAPGAIKNPATKSPTCATSWPLLTANSGQPGVDQSIRPWSTCLSADCKAARTTARPSWRLADVVGDRVGLLPPGRATSI